MIPLRNRHKVRMVEWNNFHNMFSHQLNDAGSHM
jgi:hypothetical protein